MWLGHHLPAFTLATYVHLLPADLPSADLLDALTAPGSHDAAGRGAMVFSPGDQSGTSRKTASGATAMDGVGGTLAVNRGRGR